jgi:hypothetical protein
MTSIYNKKFRTKYIHGGTVIAKNQPKYMNSHDSIKAILQVGEIVIPVKHSKKVSKLLKDNNIILPNMK